MRHSTHAATVPHYGSRYGSHHTPSHRDLPTLPSGELARLALLALWLLLRRAPRTVTRWHERAKQRAALAELSDHLLRDIGITPRQARDESDKWFWER
jgi:uncharacterized protein YjiS (DUF1127 family)